MRNHLLKSVSILLVIIRLNLMDVSTFACNKIYNVCHSVTYARPCLHGYVKYSAKLRVCMCEAERGRERGACARAHNMNIQLWEHIAFKPSSVHGTSQKRFIITQANIFGIYHCMF